MAFILPNCEKKIHIEILEFFRVMTFFVPRRLKRTSTSRVPEFDIARQTKITLTQEKLLSNEKK